MTEHYDDAIVEKAARALFAEEQCDRRQRQDVEGNWNARLAPEDQDEYRSLARAVLDAAAGEIAAGWHREGYETARADLTSGAFIGGPTYEALRDSFTGREIAARALEDVADTFLWAGDDEDYQAFRALLRDRAARLREGGE
jgi:hypothetical protein